MTLKGDLSSLKKLKQTIAQLPQTLQNHVAQEAAGKLNAMILEDYASGKTVYGTSRPLGVNGNSLDLSNTGNAQGSFELYVVGSLIRVRFAVPYAKYLVGKYKVMPNGNEPIPVRWRQVLKWIVDSYAPPFSA
jgi:hypothetical protein